MSDHVMIREDELLGSLAEVEACPDCTGGRGVHVDFATGDYEGVVVHSVPCPQAPNPRPRLHVVRLPDTDSHRRCRRCGKALLVDVGGGIFGEVESEELCVNCDSRPTAYDTA